MCCSLLEVSTELQTYGLQFTWSFNKTANTNVALYLKFQQNCKLMCCTLLEVSTKLQIHMLHFTWSFNKTATIYVMYLCIFRNKCWIYISPWGCLPRVCACKIKSEILQVPGCELFLLSSCCSGSLPLDVKYISSDTPGVENKNFEPAATHSHPLLQHCCKVIRAEVLGHACAPAGEINLEICYNMHAAT